MAKSIQIQPQHMASMRRGALVCKELHYKLVTPTRPAMPMQPAGITSTPSLQQAVLAHAHTRSAIIGANAQRTWSITWSYRTPPRAR